jgi:hypothetical protein
MEQFKGIKTGRKDCKGIDICEGSILHFPMYNADGVVVWFDMYLTFWVELKDRPPTHKQDGSLFDFLTSVGWCDYYEVKGSIYA